MSEKWTEFPAAAAAVSGDVLVGLAGGSTNARFTVASLLLKAQNLSDVANVITSFDNLCPTTTHGDMVYHNGTYNVRLAIGTINQIMSVDGSANPVWIANPGLLIAQNLNDVGNKATARTNLGVVMGPGAGTNSAIGGVTSTAAGTFAWAFGNSSSAVGNYAFAHGNGAIATNNGSVVWGDSNAAPNVDSAANQFNLTFANGYRLFGGSVNVNTAGKGLAVAEGSNAKQGVVTLVSGVGVVANTSVGANSRIMYSGQTTGVTGFLSITARTNGSGFTITSSVLSDNGVVAYEIFEPAA